LTGPHTAAPAVASAPDKTDRRDSERIGGSQEAGRCEGTVKLRFASGFVVYYHGTRLRLYQATIFR